tara:strand:+ start:2785 stop:3027 length:243 start_codon:yes stop_codon:yes gene_type:complete
MIKVFEFRCTNGHIFEDFVDGTTTTSRCGCGAKATKIVSATKCVLDGSTGDFPGRHAKWVREHEEAGRRGRVARQKAGQL